MAKKKYFELKDFPNLNLASPSEAANLVKSGSRIIVSANANTPTTFLDSLFRRAHELEDVEMSEDDINKFKSAYYYPYLAICIGVLINFTKIIKVKL